MNLSLPFSSVATNIFSVYRLVGTSHLRRLFHSHPLLFATRFFRPFSARFCVVSFTLLPLWSPARDHFCISIPVSFFSMYDIFVDYDQFSHPLTFLDRHRHTERPGHLFAMWSFLPPPIDYADLRW